jgi:hypothetical protein
VRIPRRHRLGDAWGHDKFSLPSCLSFSIRNSRLYASLRDASVRGWNAPDPRGLQILVEIQRDQRVSGRSGRICGFVRCSLILLKIFDRRPAFVYSNCVLAASRRERVRGAPLPVMWSDMRGVMPTRSAIRLCDAALQACQPAIVSDPSSLPPHASPPVVPDS